MGVADGTVTSAAEGPSEHTIGAAGVETGLLNILHGGSSNVSYNSYSTGQKLVAQNLMTQAGILGSDAGYEERMWAGVQTATLAPLETGEIDLSGFNDGKSLNMRRVLRRRGETVATEVFANYFYEEADTIAAASAKGYGNVMWAGLPSSVAGLSE